MARRQGYMLLPDDDFLAPIARRYDRHAIQVGDQVGALRVDSVLGKQGNVSTVYKARALSDRPDDGIEKNRIYIIKGIPQQESRHHTTNTRNLRSFFNEMRILPHIRHPGRNNIVELVDYNDDPSKGKLYMAFKEVAYQAVREKYDNKQVDPAIVLGVTLGLCRGLAHLHSLGIAHGDVKPENFMIDFGGIARLVDFGSAFFYGRKGSRGRIFPSDPVEYREAFTPLYTPPEVAKFKLYELGKNPKTEKADAWALGLTLGELLTGERPYYWLEDFSLQSILETIGRGVPPIRVVDLESLATHAPRKAIADIYRFLVSLVSRFIEPSAERRLSCADAFGETLQFHDHAGLSRGGDPAPKLQGKVEMARKLASLDQDADSEDQPSRRRRQLDSAQLELKAYEMKQEYLRKQTQRKEKGKVQKGWTPGFEKVDLPGEEDKGKRRFDSYEDFVRAKDGPPTLKAEDPKGGSLSFEDFRKQREEESFERMKDLFTDMGGDTREGAAGTSPAADTVNDPLDQPPSDDTEKLDVFTPRSDPMSPDRKGSPPPRRPDPRPTRPLSAKPDTRKQGFSSDADSVDLEPKDHDLSVLDTIDEPLPRSGTGRKAPPVSEPDSVELEAKDHDFSVLDTIDEPLHPQRTHPPRDRSGRDPRPTVREDFCGDETLPGPVDSGPEPAGEEDISIAETLPGPPDDPRPTIRQEFSGLETLDEMPPHFRRLRKKKPKPKPRRPMEGEATQPD